MRIRIQDYDLRLDDILKFPVWEYALDEVTLDGQDERTIRPYRIKPPLNPNSSYFIVRASFSLADGTHMKGLIKPIALVPGKPRFLSTIIPYDLSPTLVTEKQQIYFCYGALKPNPDEIAETYRFLGKRSSEIFPIRFRSDIKILNSITEGMLEGFMYFDEDKEDFYHLQSSDINYTK